MIMKYELDKIIKNKIFLVASIVSLMVIAGIFLLGYHYSQLTFAEQKNTEKGYPGFYSEVTNEHAGEFDDQKVEEILTDFMDRYQSNIESERPLDVFSWGVAGVFFPKEEDIYLKMNNAMEEGEKITFDEIDIPTLEEVGFANFNTPLNIGGYNTWGDFFNVTNSLFMLASLFIIFICSSIFSSEASANINQLLLSTKYGRGKLTIAKIIVAIWVSILIFLVIQLISLIFFYTYHGLSGWDANIQTNFSVMLYNFPIYMNNFQVYLLVIGVQMIGVLSIIGITLLISSMTKSPFISLAISLGIFFVPFLLGKIYQTGIVAKILNLFPIQNYQVEEMLTKMQSNTFFFLDSFIPNIILTIGVALIIKVVANSILYFKMKYSQVKSI